MRNGHFHIQSFRRLGSAVLFIAFLGFGEQSAATDLPSIGGSGGSPYRILCPAGSFLTGFEGRAGDYVDRLGLVCSKWSGSELESGQFQHVYAGTSRGGKAQQVFCPAQHVVHGADFSVLSSDAQLLDEFSFECIYMKRPEGNGQRFNFTSTGSRGGWSFGGRSGWHFCPPDEVVIGIYGRSGDFVDRIGLVCDLTPQARFQSLVLRILAVLVATFGLGVVLRRKWIGIKKS
ncbi:jacalin family lectin [Methylococcus mesophilus]|uniref:hypothetical protein n=1 Tax=Methylococcus mesophilus TaxID=2993564 RepID=UPI00224B5CDD|nr:hypothetical protein [Methylococcus mesophilus]UZR29046.1 hypothetical protein OOT43_00030 [Methylococcus mesophilus]